MENSFSENTKHTNILFLGAGRRVSLAKRFIDRGYKVYSYEIGNQLPIASIATVVNGLCWSDNDVLTHIANVCVENSIKLIIPFQDGAIPICSKLRLEGFSCACSEYTASEICFNKQQFEFFMLQNFENLYPKETSKFPKIVKPIFGNSSRGVCTIHSDLDKIDRNGYVVQAKVDGVEYSVDAFFDSNGSFIDAISRKRIRVTGGEVITSLVEKYDVLIQNTKLVGEKLQLKGPVCFQYMVNSRPYLFEINARFGGGATLSIEAGFDMVGLIEKYYLHKEISYIPGIWKDGLLMERCYRDYFYE